MGTSFTCTMQTFVTKNNQRLFTSSGLAAMGYGIPGSIGSSFANLKVDTICVTGDGGTMFNIQELQTIAHHKLPIKIFVLLLGTTINYAKIFVGQIPNWFHPFAKFESI